MEKLEWNILPQLLHKMVQNKTSSNNYTIISS